MDVHIDIFLSSDRPNPYAICPKHTLTMDWDRNWPWCHGRKLTPAHQVWVSWSIFNVGAGNQGPPLSNGDPTNIYPLFLSSVLQCSNPREKRWTASLNALWMRWEPCGQTIDTSYLLIVLKYLRNKISTNVLYWCESFQIWKESPEVYEWARVDNCSGKNARSLAFSR